MTRAKPFNREQWERNVAALPSVAIAVHTMTGEAILINRGESGFRPIDTDKFPLAASNPAAFVREQNAAMEVTPAQSKAMLFGSLFGWDVPGAHPDAVINQEFATSE